MLEKSSFKIKIVKNGPYLISGKIPLAKEAIISDEYKDPIKWKKVKDLPLKENYALCRCGHSNNKPYCDGTHIAVKFNGTETAGNKKFMKEAKKIEGPNLILMDNTKLCSSARFCHFGGGIWELTRQSKNLKCKKEAIKEVWNCPSGRLVVLDKKTKKEIEPKLKQSISLIEDPDNNVAGPIWVKGKIIIESADGVKYELRNRVTLCRCGYSDNKPFCDTTHISTGFKDE